MDTPSWIRGHARTKSEGQDGEDLPPAGRHHLGRRRAAQQDCCRIHYCTVAAELAEGFGDEQAKVRLLERAKAVQALSEAMWQGLSPEEREREETRQNMHLLARRWSEVCQQGLKKYCGLLEKYCATGGGPPDVCPEPVPTREDAGPP